MRSSPALLRFLAPLVIAPALFAAEPAGEGDARLRSALRDATLQLRTAQNDLANLQATQAAWATEKKELTDKYEIVRKQAAADRAATDKSAAALTAQLAALKQQVAQVTAALEQAKAEGEKSAAAAHTSGEQGARLTVEVAQLQRRVADREAKNLALFMIGNEILSRYEEFSLGNALRAKEPFIGRTRTKLENLVQDYEDKLRDNRLQPER